MKIPSTRSAFNNSVDFVLARPGYQVRLACIGVAALLVWYFIAGHDANVREDGRQSLRDSLAAVTIVELRHRVDTARAHMAKDGVVVTRTVHRLDTLWRDVPVIPETPAETLQAIASLPVLRRATDSAIAACTDFQVSCADYRRSADSLERVLRAQNAMLAMRLNKLQPSKRRAVVTWAGLLAAGYIGYRIGNHR